MYTEKRSQCLRSKEHGCVVRGMRFGILPLTGRGKRGLDVWGYVLLVYSHDVRVCSRGQEGGQGEVESCFSARTFPGIFIVPVTPNKKKSGWCRLQASPEMVATLLHGMLKVTWQCLAVCSSKNKHLCSESHSMLPFKIQENLVDSFLFVVFAQLLRPEAQVLFSSHSMVCISFFSMVCICILCFPYWLLHPKTTMAHH